MCYSIYKKCYNCPTKFDFSVVFCPSGKAGRTCIPRENVVNGELVIRVKAIFPPTDGSVRGCDLGYVHGEQDPIAALMETAERGGYCSVCKAEDDCLILNDMSTPVVHRKRQASRPDIRKVMPLKKKRRLDSERVPLGDVTYKANSS